MEFKYHQMLLVFLYLIHLVLTNDDENVLHNPTKLNCGMDFKEKTNGELAYNAKKRSIPENVTCTWTIMSDSEIFLELDGFALFENDSFVITSDNKIIFGPYSGFQGRFIIGTGVTNLVAELKTSPVKYHSERSFFAKFSTKECKMDMKNLMSGSISSPVYNNDRNEELKCTYYVNGFGTTMMLSLALTLTNFTFNRSKFHITSQKETYENPTNLPRKLFIKGQGKIDILINPGSHNEYFKMRYEIVPDACSGKITLNESYPTHTVSFLSPPNPQNSPLTKDSIRCEWLVTSPPGTKIKSNFPVLDLKSSQDKLEILSPVPQFQPVVLSVHNNHLFRDKSIVSPSNEFWVNFDTFQNMGEPQFKAEFSILKPQESDLNEEAGKITLQDIRDYNFKVKADKVVKIQFDDKINEDTVLELYPDLINGKPYFLTIDRNYPLQWVSSPTNELKIVVRNIRKPLDIRFSGEDRGCNLTLVEDQGFIDLSSSCHDKCLLVLPYKDSTDIFKIKIETTQVGILVNSLTRSVIPLLEFDEAKDYNVAKVDVPVRDGAMITVKRNCQSSKTNKVKISYSTEESCERTYKLSVGESAAIFSPNFPDAYAFNSKCHWKIESISKQPTSFFVTFNKFNLGDDDSLRLNDIGLLKRESQDVITMPEDYIFRSPLEIKFESQTRHVFDKAPNFLFHITAIECGGIKTVSEGVLSFSHSNMTSDLCIWSVSVPFLTQFQYTSIKVQLSHGKTGLTIYDGVSVRSPVLRVSKDGTGVSSSNQILIEYKRSGATDSQMPVQVEYRAFGCDETSVCKNGACLAKPEFKCNGINDCGDYSDEIGCVVTHPSTPSTLPTTKYVKSTQKTTLSTAKAAEITSKPSEGSSRKVETTENLSNYETPPVTICVETTNVLPHKEAVEEMDHKVSMSTMIYAIVGVVIGFGVSVISLYIYQRKNFKKKYQNPNRWESLSTTNPSYQSDKDIENPPPLPVAHIRVTQESARHQENLNRER